MYAEGFSEFLGEINNISIMKASVSFLRSLGKKHNFPKLEKRGERQASVTGIRSRTRLPHFRTCLLFCERRVISLRRVTGPVVVIAADIPTKPTALK